MDLIFEIPGKIKVEWEPSARAVIDRWSALSQVTLAEFRSAVLEKGLPYASAHRGRAYIVDNSAAKGAYIQDIQNFIGSDVFPAFAKAGIKYFLTVPSQDSPLANLAAKKYSAKVGPHGIQLVEVRSVADAVQWLKENAK